MSYFGRVIDRTIGSAMRSVRPTITLDSIPEGPAMATGSAPSSRIRKKYVPPEKDVNGQLEHTPSTEKADSPKDDTMNRSITTKQEPPSRWGQLNEQEGSAAAQMAKNDPADNSGHSTDIRANYNKEIEPADKPIANKDTPEILPAYNHLPDSSQELVPLKGSAPSANSKIDKNPRQSKSPSVAPAVQNSVSYDPATFSSQEETVVTINIGRIEVRVEPQQLEPVKRQRNKFSPALSLADYLKQRSEGKIG
jgi:hypothetical protein